MFYMEFRNWIGIILIVIGASLQVVSIYDTMIFRVVGFVLIVIGVAIFGTQRYIAYSERNQYNYGPSRKNTSLPIMGDIFNSTGQRTGGRKEEFGDSSSGLSGFSDGGGSGGGD